MSLCVLQVVFKPNPVADMMKLMETVNQTATMWKCHGADVLLSAVSTRIGSLIYHRVCSIGRSDKRA